MISLLSLHLGLLAKFSVASFSAGLSDAREAAIQHDEQVHGHVEETRRNVIEAKFVPGLWLGHKIRKTEQKVGQGEYRGFIECFDVFQKVVSERPVPLQVHAHAQETDI